MTPQRWIAFATAALAVGGVARADAPPPSALERTIPTQVQPRSSGPALILPERTIVPSSDKTRFTLSALNIDGATVYSQQQLSPFFEPYLATRVDEGKLQEIAQAITKHYRRAGYILSYATVPAQNVEAGMVRIQVIEGSVTNVIIEGAGSDTARLKSIAAPLIKQTVLRRSTLERTLGLIRDFPGLKVVDTALIQSDVKAGLYSLKLTVVPAKVRGIAYSDNRGISGMGRSRVYSSASVSSIVTAGDELRVDLFGMPDNRSRYIYGQLHVAAPFGDNGLRGALSASRGNLYLGAAEHFRGRSDILTAELSYPLRRRRNLSIIAAALLSDSRTVGSASGTRQLRDHFRVARLALTFTSEGPTQIRGDLVLSEGLPFRGGTRTGDLFASRVGASATFSKVTASLDVTRRLSSQLTLRATAMAQYADRPLLSPEEFSLGGNRLGRAFEFNAVTGARGAGAGVELGYRAGKRKDKHLVPEIFAFADCGFATTLRALNSLVDTRTLGSMGTGIRLSEGKTGMSLEAAIPVSRGIRRSPKLFVTLFRLF